MVYKDVLATPRSSRSVKEERHTKNIIIYVSILEDRIYWLLHLKTITFASEKNIITNAKDFQEWISKVGWEK